MLKNCKPDHADKDPHTTPIMIQNINLEEFKSKSGYLI